MDIKSLRPMGDRVLVRRDTTKTETDSGIIYAVATSKQKPLTGTVVAISNDLSDKKIFIGDTLFFPKYGGMELDIDGIEHLVLLYSDIIGVVELKTNKTKK